MTRIISVLATTLLAAGLSAQAFAAELPTSANFNGASQQDVRRVLGDLGFGNVKILAQRGRVFDVIANWEGRQVDLRVHSGSNSGAGWGSITEKTVMAAADPQKIPTSANFNDEDASQQDVQRVLGDLGRLLGLGRRRHYEYSSRRNYRHYGYPSYSYGRDYGYSPYYRYYGGHGSRRGQSFGRH